ARGNLDRSSWNSGRRTAAGAAIRRMLLLAADRRLQVGFELIDILLGDDLARNDVDLFGRRIAFEGRRQHLHALVAPLERLLHDRAGEAALTHRTERDRVLVEADHRDLAQLAGVAQRLVDAGR